MACESGTDNVDCCAVALQLGGPGGGGANSAKDVAWLGSVNVFPCAVSGRMTAATTNTIMALVASNESTVTSHDPLWEEEAARAASSRELLVGVIATEPFRPGRDRHHRRLCT